MSPLDYVLVVLGGILLFDAAFLALFAFLAWRHDREEARRRPPGAEDVGPIRRELPRDLRDREVA